MKYLNSFGKMSVYNIIAYYGLSSLYYIIRYIVDSKEDLINGHGQEKVIALDDR